MHKLQHLFLSIIFCCLYAAFSHAAPLNSGSPAGRWQSLFPGNNIPQFIMQVTESNGVLTGTIVEVFAKPGRKEQEICARCTGERKDQPLLGMTILANATFDPKAQMWVNGIYVDPNTGRTYNASVWASGKQALRIRASTSSNGNGLSHNYRWQRVG